MDPVLDALRALAAPPPWLIAASDGPHLAEVLVRATPERSDERTRLLACNVEDLRLKGSRWVGRYRLTVSGADGGVRDVAVTGVLDPGQPAAPSLRADVPFGHADWSISLPDPPLTLRPAAADRKLAALPLLTDPAQARGWLERNLSHAFPGIRITSCDPVVARYRPGQRCTVICHLTYDPDADPAWPETVVAKIHRSGEGAHAYGALEALASARFDDTSGLEFAAPLAYLPSTDVSLQGNLPADRSLTDLLLRASSGTEDAAAEAEVAVRRVADALVALHDAPVRYGSLIAIDDEIASARRAGARLGAALPDLRDAVEPFLRLVEARTVEFPANPARPSHGAFRPAQVRLTGDRVGLLDLDGFCQCEPAQDVGRFVGKLRLVVLGTTAGTADLAARIAAADRLVAAFLDQYGRAGRVSPVRVTLWESLDLVKALLQSWSRVRPGQIGQVLALLEGRVAALRQQVSALA